ncbi:serine carboxypeptidase 3-like [Rosa rugosa]|uniref:serine carboxypeptidase 3-like n=1 Tax=Rosa rugosa TaxID=74645 RepID=UPI002B412A31|nr:serine carboxypeptidase 3-like [Rosa rugosa]
MKFRVFYLFFESCTNKKDPVVTWLTGGPGCSSELAVFYENGPFTIVNNLSLVWNEYGWDKFHILAVDDSIIHRKVNEKLYNISYSKGSFCLSNDSPNIRVLIQASRIVEIPFLWIGKP